MITTLCQDKAPLPSDFARLQQNSIEELKVKTDAHKQIWADKIERWDLNQDSGNLVFALKDGMKAVCPAQIIGSYNSKDQTWLWAWANPSIDEKLKADALKLKKYGEEHHIDRLITRKWVGTEEDAWAMVALAVKLCGEQGAYRGPAGTTYVFIAFGEVVLTKN
jgi:hypothetical protein